MRLIKNQNLKIKNLHDASVMQIFLEHAEDHTYKDHKETVNKELLLLFSDCILDFRKDFIALSTPLMPSATFWIAGEM